MEPEHVPWDPLAISLHPHGHKKEEVRSDKRWDFKTEPRTFRAVREPQRTVQHIRMNLGFKSGVLGSKPNSAMCSWVRGVTVERMDLLRSHPHPSPNPIE